MSKPKNTSEIARETLTALSSRKLAPTPENYEQMYREISGEPAPAPSAEIGATTSKGKLVPAWSDLIRDLLHQLETPHKGITVTRKKDGVETVLTRFSKDPEVLFGKLQSLLRSWSTAPTGPSTGDLVPSDIPGAAPVTSSPQPSATFYRLTCAGR